LANSRGGIKKTDAKAGGEEKGKKKGKEGRKGRGREWEKEKVFKRGMCKKQGVATEPNCGDEVSTHNVVSKKPKK